MTAPLKISVFKELNQRNDELEDYAINALQNVEESILKLQFYKKKLEELLEKNEINI